MTTENNAKPADELVTVSRTRLLVVRAVGALAILVGLLFAYLDLGTLRNYSQQIMFLGFGWVVATLILDPKMRPKQ